MMVVCVKTRAACMGSGGMEDNFVFLFFLRLPVAGQETAAAVYSLENQERRLRIFFLDSKSVGIQGQAESLCLGMGSTCVLLTRVSVL